MMARTKIEQGTTRNVLSSCMRQPIKAVAAAGVALALLSGSASAQDKNQEKTIANVFYVCTKINDISGKAVSGGPADFIEVARKVVKGDNDAVALYNVVVDTCLMDRMGAVVQTR